MSKLSKEVIQEFIKRGHFKSEGSVRNFISSIKTNEGLNCTQAAAAQVAAKIKGFSIANRLRKEDFVPQNLSEIVAKYGKSNAGTNRSPRKINFKRKIKNSNNPTEKAAYFNASLYPSIYILENELRKLIFRRLGNNLSWWKKEYVTQGIIDYADKIAKEDKKVLGFLVQISIHCI